MAENRPNIIVSKSVATFSAIILIMNIHIISQNCTQAQRGRWALAFTKIWRKWVV